MSDLFGYRIMRQLRSASAGPRMPGPCKPNFVSLEAGLVPRWSEDNPSARLMVDPRSGTRVVIRDTGVDPSKIVHNGCRCLASEAGYGDE